MTDHSAQAEVMNHSAAAAGVMGHSVQVWVTDRQQAAGSYRPVDRVPVMDRVRMQVTGHSAQVWVTDRWAADRVSLQVMDHSVRAMMMNQSVHHSMNLMVLALNRQVASADPMIVVHLHSTIEYRRYCYPTMRMAYPDHHRKCDWRTAAPTEG